MEHKLLTLTQAKTSQIPTGSEVTGVGNMLSTVYDPDGLGLDAFDRATHYGLISSDLVDGFGPVAFLSVGSEEDQVSSGDHTHIYFLADMMESMYDPSGLKLDAFDRASHTNTQLLETISDAGLVAGLNTGVASGTVAEGFHGHQYLSFFTHNPQRREENIFKRDNHFNQQDYSTITGLGNVAIMDIGEGGGFASSSIHDDYDSHKMMGAGEFMGGIAGLAPAPPIGSANKVLYGNAAWGTPFRDLFGLELPRDAIPLMTSNKSGAVPEPQPGDNEKVLTGDGQWKGPVMVSTANGPVPGHSLPEYDVGLYGAVPAPPATYQTRLLSGDPSSPWTTFLDALGPEGFDENAIPIFGIATVGLAPAPPTGATGYVLTGNSQWTNLSSLLVGDIDVPVDSIPLMGGATGTGESGLVPAQLNENATQALQGSGLWKDIAVHIPPQDPDSFETMGGSTQTTHGAIGMVPLQPSGSQSHVLTAAGDWVALTEFISDVGLFFAASDLPAMNGDPGMVPAQPLNSESKVLTGSAEWKSMGEIALADPAFLSTLPVFGIGANGLVPAPQIADELSFFVGGGTWVAPAGDVFNVVGDWVSGTEYTINQIVIYELNSYICTAPTDSVEPPDPASWDLFAATGGMGSDGPPGAGVPTSYRERSDTNENVTAQAAVVQLSSALLSQSSAIGSQESFFPSDDVEVDNNLSTAQWEFNSWVNANKPWVGLDSRGINIRLTALDDVLCIGQAFSISEQTTVKGLRVILRKVGLHTGSVTIRMFAATGTPGSSGSVAATPTYVAETTIQLADIQDVPVWMDAVFSTPYSASAGNYGFMIFPTDVADTLVQIGSTGDDLEASSNVIFADYEVDSPYITNIRSAIPPNNRNQVDTHYGNVGFSGHIASDSNGDYRAWTSFNGVSNNGSNFGIAQLPIWYNYEFVDHPRILVEYRITAWSGPETPTAWTLNGSNDGETWTELDSQSGITDWTSNMEKSFTITGAGAYTQYRLIATTNNGSGTTVSIGNIQLIGDKKPIKDTFFSVIRDTSDLELISDAISW